MALLPPFLRHLQIVERDGRQTTRFADWLVELWQAVNRLIDGIFDGAITAASITVTGAVTAASAAISGAITAATLTLSGLFTLTGGQIQFPATQVPSADPNTLDDYEEGTVAPTSPNITYASGGLNYLKLGPWVFITGTVVFPATADGNTAAINNLPFTCENTQQARGGCVCHYTNAAVPVGMLVANNSTTVQFVRPEAGGALLTNANLTGLTVFFAFHYKAMQ